MLGILISLSACASQPYYGEMTTADRTNTGNSIYGLFYNWGNANAYTIPKADRQRHQRCVYFALNKTQPGQTCSWHGPESGASGIIKLIGRWNQSDDKLDRKFDALTKEINDLDNQVSELKGSMSRINGRH